MNKDVYKTLGERRNACQLVRDIFDGYDLRRPWHTKVDNKYQFTEDGQKRLEDLLNSEPEWINMFGWFCKHINDTDKVNIKNKNQTFGDDGNLDLKMMTVFIR